MSTKTPTQYELESRWVNYGIPGVSHHFSDLVRIKSGEDVGRIAEVIHLLAIDPEPIYGVVLPPNERFVRLPESQLEATGSNAGRTLILHKP